jgi:hypothetical protein
MSANRVLLLKKKMPSELERPTNGGGPDSRATLPLVHAK